MLKIVRFDPLKFSFKFWILFAARGAAQPSEKQENNFPKALLGSGENNHHSDPKTAPPLACILPSGWRWPGG